MTTLVPFLPSNATTPPFQATVTLDGVAYSLSVTWNIAGMRWYVTLTDQNGNVTWCGAMAGSPLDFDILLAPGIFSTSTLLYREDTGNFEITP
ncbi:hypothetical protein KDW55_02445 [Burkholderia sp. AU19243]|uniref:phage baseplate plug family protein n=1 Tax=Burkholderia sp. AU19243 TaxID=2824810 RepID=UPI001B925F43|nr:hypothetical protein [Burkholderia sp. AU19243]MBR8141221.1 hypothetical protein [Burkholderia vietnamiensis]MBR8362177.1 hypothetical protein [Burkholderia sp. AU19243]